MKIIMGFDTEAAGTAETTEDGKIQYTGKEPERVQKIVQFYQRGSGLEGEELLHLVLQRVRGRCWTREEKQ